VTRGIGPKTTRDHKATMVTTSSMAKEATSVSVVGANGTSANGGSGQDKYSSSKVAERTEDGATEKGPLCNGGGQREELLYLQQIRTYGLTL